VPHVETVAADQLAELEARLASWPIPGFAPIAGTWLGSLPASTLFGGARGAFRRRSEEAWVEIFPWAGVTLPVGDLADGYLYLGPVKTHTYSHPDPALFEDEDGFDRKIRDASNSWPVSQYHHCKVRCSRCSYCATQTHSDRC